MSSAMPAGNGGTAADAYKILDNRARRTAHVASELHPDVDGIMATVTPTDQLTWAGTLAWALCAPGPNGDPHLMTWTREEEVRKFYEWRVSQDLPGMPVPAQTAFANSWFWFGEAQPQAMHDPKTGEQSRFICPISVLTMDGNQGISSEIVWIRSTEPTVEKAILVANWRSYLAAFSAQDADRLVDLMAPNVLGAVRDYAGADPDFVAIRGREEMRSYYQRLFDTFEVLDVGELVSFLRDWFVFQELFLTLRARHGERSGQQFTVRLAEALVFDKDGSFQGRVGYGTALEPL